MGRVSRCEDRRSSQKNQVQSNIQSKQFRMPVSDIVAPSLSTHQDEDAFSYAKVDKAEIKRNHLQHLAGEDYLQKIYEYYSLEELVGLLSEKIAVAEGQELFKYKRITFQFPDSLVCDSAAVAQEVQKRLGLTSEVQKQNGERAQNDVPEEDACACGSHVLSGSCKKEASCSKDGCCTEKSPLDKQRIWILADTSYSSCCIDEVAAEHVSGDLVVHFGDACLNPAASIKSAYIFGKPSVDIDELVKAFKTRYPLEEFAESKIVLMADAPHTHLLFDIAQKLPEYSTFVADLEVKDVNATVLGYKQNTFSGNELRSMNRVFLGIIASEQGPSSYGESDSESDSGINSKYDEVLTTYELFHISQPEAPRLLQLTTKFQSVSVFDPVSNRVAQGPFPNLMRRYRYMHMARAAGTIGILVNTLSLANTKSLVNGISKKIREEGKKHYIFVVGKPNVAKLANFDVIDMWCILGCDHQGIILDQTSEYFKPIVTPYELLLALSDEVSWTGKWVTDFNRILEDLGVEADESDTAEKEPTELKDEDEEPQFNPVTGQYVSNARPLHRLQHLQITLEENEEEETGALVKKLSSAVAVRGTYSTSAAHLQTREWTGLGSDWQDNDDGEGALVEEGHSGVARGYDYDRDNKP